MNSTADSSAVWLELAEADCTVTLDSVSYKLWRQANPQ